MIDDHRDLTKVCPLCGTAGVRRDSTFCSKACAAQAGTSGAKGWTRRGIALRKLRQAESGSSGTRVLAAGPCLACGQLTIWMHSSWRTCSRRCHSKIANRNKALAKRGRQRIRRIAIFERDDYICALCGEPTDRDVAVPHPLAPTIDHVHPRIHGGTDDPSNLQCAHFECNWRKGDTLISAA